MRASPLLSLALSLLGLLTPAGPARAAGGPAIHSGSSMVYLANSSPPGFRLQWVSPFFDDSSWTPGVYGVGYESNPPGATGLIGTPVPAGTFSVFTRARFTIDDPRAISSIFLGADYDDGYVAWINGVEVARSPGMPAGSPAWNTRAAPHESSNGVLPDYGLAAEVTARARPALHAGENVLAIGVWNSGAPASDDFVMVPRLFIGGMVSVTRGPYLQMGTPTSVVVRWRTASATDGRVLYGTDPSALALSSAVPGPTTERADRLVVGSPIPGPSRPLCDCAPVVGLLISSAWMTLTGGMRLGPCENPAPIGSGGMGEDL